MCQYTFEVKSSYLIYGLKKTVEENLGRVSLFHRLYGERKIKNKKHQITKINVSLDIVTLEIPFMSVTRSSRMQNDRALIRVACNKKDK